jgi:methionyl-tRNA synthetase
MAKKDTFYVTTPIYYPNDIPHLGHAYTSISADVLARWNKIIGKDVFFLTGTDDHGKKLEKAAEKVGKKPKEFIDAIIPEFKSAWRKLNIEYDYFIRTTDKDHEKIVQEVLQKCFDNGDIYKGNYEGLYCVDCEAYYTEKDAIDKICPVHKRPLELLKEESYFFKLSKYQKFLLDLYKKDTDFISPAGKRQEIINRVKEDLRDFSISRTSFKWGIPLPFDKKHICYVWFDALLNYYSATRIKGREKYWPADVHIIGKDILWFHAVYWPAMLKSAGIELPKKLFAHGWWTVHNQKMGKSAGNAIKIDQLISYAGVDPARYFLLRSAPFGDDGDFSEEALIERNNNELADKLGNLVSRVSALAEKYGIQKSKIKELDSSKVVKKYSECLDKLEFDKALNEVFGFIDKCNEFVQSNKPWESHDSKVLYELSNAIKDIAILLSPFIPQSCEKIANTFGFEISEKNLKTELKVSEIKKSDILFNKIEKKEVKNEEQKVNKTHSIEGIMTSIDYKDWEKIDLRVGKIEKVEDIDGADKLYKLSVNVGKETKTVCAGLKKFYKKEELKGKKIILFVNLAPRMMRGIESQGMILAAVSEDESQVIFLQPEKDIKEGSKVR